MPAHLANGDNLSPFVTGQPSPIPGKMFSKVLKINEPSKTAPTELINGDNLSPRLSLSINEPSEATPTQGPFLFSGTQEKAQPIVKFNPRLSTPKNGASNNVNVNWPLPYTRTVGPVNEEGFAVVTQTWYDYSSMTDSDSQSSGSPRSFHFDPRSFPPSPNTHTSPVLRPARWKSSQEAALYYGISPWLPSVLQPGSWSSQPYYLWLIGPTHN
ncbi:hypothetical protein N7530_004916 [Penicillium desertorum]|uniref:Uncharacterized protein n=1 Tax=Penicillium desertorum TaxID=1303715 RepID=A0A9X0BR77_9EURO|nr:hypothetical protein N7530_004916 [Penicillium desertorum]